MTSRDVHVTVDLAIDAGTVGGNSQILSHPARNFDMSAAKRGLSIHRCAVRDSNVTPGNSRMATDVAFDRNVSSNRKQTLGHVLVDANVTASNKCVAANRL